MVCGPSRRGDGHASEGARGGPQAAVVVLPSRAGLRDRTRLRTAAERPLMRRSVCIVSPGHVAPNPPAVKEADALHGAGYSASVTPATEPPIVRTFVEATTAPASWSAVRAGPATLR